MGDPLFEKAYERMMERALAESRGERKRRLLEEHGHAEKMLLARVWWPAVGNLDYLHPEYELRDLREGTRFSDYGYLPSPVLGLLLEADGFGPHWRDISRWKFDQDAERQNLLMIGGWRMLRFSYDGIMEKSARCQQTLLLALAKWGGATAAEREASHRWNVYERAILHDGQTPGLEKLTPVRVAVELGISARIARLYLNSLAEKGDLVPKLSPTGRKVGYFLADAARRMTRTEQDASMSEPRVRTKAGSRGNGGKSELRVRT